ncbi:MULTISPECIES: thiolase family protein [Cytobacillus]|jgi:acetyl-CoA acyltransferase|uniref:Thiolase family protein n=1 Tax=Cytobacillus pseudoceanisediminis TaxID=3051614 RepID=A0ABZ2ZGX7_9BACI|nr:thiolase family protein [Cytobacillus oceanisediminis]MBY0155134.1 thiolase family protein [Cytobacillus firmus]MBU8769862.1 acetyl-CoA C-acyltransferase [Cytobacillus oceanisediminis]MCM3393432.1 thiolase family protein [Cytobacillus oceanisediminis]MCM3403887.1 thiolase family protein [Cytobacillus oceanisediminis]MCM3530530.1 thiolase family protein [Cytobacillus oceanisediminis]
MREAVIVEGVRTPVGRKNGFLKDIRADDLAAEALMALVERAGIDPQIIDDVILGCVSQIGEQTGDIARVAALIAGFPIEVPGTTIDRQCGSSQQAVHFAAQAILAGDMEIVIAGGVESMSRVPIGSSYQGVGFSEKLTDKHEIIHQGLSAERIAEKYGFTREELDRYSLESHQKALKAQDEGRFEREIAPLNVKLPDGQLMTVSEDSGPRKETSLEALGSLRAVFKENGVIHAGNSSQISDGAAALLIMSRDKAEELGMKPRFRILSRTAVGSDPTLMLTGPIPATEKVLKNAGLAIEDIDVFEVNEAFAPVPLAWLKETGADPAKLNPNGGAIALGHPLGGSGARLMVTMMHELERTGGRYGLQTMCEGLGMANATIIERLD